MEALKRFENKTISVGGDYLDCVFEGCTLYRAPRTPVVFDGCEFVRCRLIGDWPKEVVAAAILPGSNWVDGEWE